MCSKSTLFLIANGGVTTGDEISGGLVTGGVTAGGLITGVTGVSDTNSGGIKKSVKSSPSSASKHALEKTKNKITKKIWRIKTYMNQF
jgi:hypothetical protein